MLGLLGELRVDVRAPEIGDVVEPAAVLFVPRDTKRVSKLGDAAGVNGSGDALKSEGVRKDHGRPKYGAVEEPDQLGHRGEELRRGIDADERSAASALDRDSADFDFPGCGIPSPDSVLPRLHPRALLTLPTEFRASD